MAQKTIRKKEKKTLRTITKTCLTWLKSLIKSQKKVTKETRKITDVERARIDNSKIISQVLS